MNKHIKKNLRIYFHGLPGSSSELNFLTKTRLEEILIVGPQDHLTVKRLVADSLPATLEIIGFSLGCMAAVKIAALYPEKVDSLTLIAPAAPLELGNFLQGMAGKPVFEVAKKGAFYFSLFTAAQNIAVRLFPNSIMTTMFKDSPDSDRDLLNNPVFTESFLSGLELSLGKNNHAYKRAILGYVSPWAELLVKVKCPVRIYHGELDNWAPIEMSQALIGSISSEVELVRYESLDHYSTLRASMKDLLEV